MSNEKRKGFICLLYPQTQFNEEMQGRNSDQEGTWTQELTQMTLRIVAYWLALPGFLSLLMEFRTTSPEVVPPIMGSALPIKC